jgi:hypothetical protein
MQDAKEMYYENSPKMNNPWIIHFFLFFFLRASVPLWLKN